MASESEKTNKPEREEVADIKVSTFFMIDII